MSLSDEQMIEYYSGLVKQYGNLMATYKNAICFVLDENHIYESMDSSLESGKFILTIKKKGFPLDSISIDIKTNQYFYDLPPKKEKKDVDKDGFLAFFQNVLDIGQDKK